MADDTKSVDALLQKRHRRQCAVIGTAVIVFFMGIAFITFLAVQSIQVHSHDTGSGSKGPPTPTATRPNRNPQRTPGPPITRQMIGYWGTNDAGNGVPDPTHPVQTTNAFTQNLRYYCNLGMYDRINLGYMTEFGNGDDHFTLNFTNTGSYQYPAGGPPPDDVTVKTFERIGNDIQFCQSKGVKVILSVGGDATSANYSFGTPGDGENAASWVLSRFLGGSGGDGVKPFGPDVVLDGIELAVRQVADEIWTMEMVAFLKAIKRQSSRSLLSVAAECSLSAESGNYLIITDPSVILDYITVQFFNHPECSYPFAFNYPTWATLFDGGIMVGLAGDWTSAPFGGFLELNDLKTMGAILMTDTQQFMGFSIDDVSTADSLYSDRASGKGYAFDVKSVLNGNSTAAQAFGTKNVTNAFIAQNYKEDWLSRFRRNKSLCNDTCRDLRDQRVGITNFDNIGNGNTSSGLGIESGVNSTNWDARNAKNESGAEWDPDAISWFVG
ncbi:glycoside hydrolase superfamily [Chytriomyces sp. MP71]|nr:glycoside hydrolase superfamily [Chytriomyces sp. MP71]